MATVSITILGNSAAVPSKGRKLSAHLLELEGRSILFDCGEGTQFQLQNFNKKINKITEIYISHLHGDHFFGLPGLFSSMHMTDRHKPLYIYGPKGLKLLPKMLKDLCDFTPKFEINFIEIEVDSKVIISKQDEYNIYAFPLLHSVSTLGYLFEQSPPIPNIKRDFVKNNEIPVEWFDRIKKGEDFVSKDGKLFKNKDITEINSKSVSYAYCTDTAYMPELSKYVNGVDVLYHESTFLQINAADAKKKMHSTAGDAARIAKEAGVGKLIIGHFSARYLNLDLFEKEACDIFENTIIGTEGLTIEI